MVILCVAAEHSELKKRKKKLENVVNANALQLEAARCKTALCRFSYDAMPSLTSLNLFMTVWWRFCCWQITLRRELDIWPCDLDLWPLKLNICRVSLWRDETLYRIWTQSNNSEVLRFQCLILWPWTCLKCCAQLWDNFHQVWTSTTSDNLSVPEL